jgi:transmembrane sensor
MKATREPAPLGARIEVPVDEARLSESWGVISARLRENERAPRRSVRPLALGVGVLAVAAMAFFSMSIPDDAPPGPLVTTEGASVESAVAASSGHAASVPLSDGSEITLGAGAVLETLESSASRVAFALREGHVRVSITPGGPRRWSVEAGAISVEVVGTIFSVDRSDEEVAVEVERGRVLVRGEGVPDGVRTLVAGEVLRIPRAVAVTATLVGEEDAAPSETVETLPAPRARSAVALPAPSVAPDAETLLREADAARRSGRFDDALELLDRAAALDGDPSAPLAAFTRGRLLLDHDRPAEAAADLGRALDGRLPAGLAESARARRIEALVRSGDHASAEREAAEYARLHPGGEHLEHIRELLR